MPNQRVHLVFNDTSNYVQINTNWCRKHVYKQPISLLEILI